MTNSDSGSGQREFWDRRAAAWERRAESVDALSDSYGLPAMDALLVAAGERVLDVGCGPGTTAIELARRVTGSGLVVGADVSPAMVAAAMRRSEALGLSNVRFVVADAQVDSLGDGFDAVYSRFGVMFFSDPVAAFANIGRALRSGGRLGCAVWAPLADNPWMFVPTLAAAPVLEAELTIPTPGEPGPFSLSETGRVEQILSEAGYVDIVTEMVQGSRLITPGSEGDNVTTLLEVGALSDAFEAADDVRRQRAIDAVIGAIEPYRESDGWRLPGAALRVTARRP